MDPDFVLRRDLVAGGYTDDELARLLRRGELSRLRRGAYLEPAPSLGVGERHRLLVHATLRSLRRPAVVSHQSAAVLGTSTTLVSIVLFTVPSPGAVAGAGRVPEHGSSCSVRRACCQDRRLR